MGLIGLVAIVAVWVYYGAVVKPLFRAVAEVSQAGRVAKGQLREIEQAFTQEPQLRRQRLQLEQQVARLRAAIPTEEGLPAVIERLTELAGQTGVKLQLIVPQRPLASATQTTGRSGEAKALRAERSAGTGEGSGLPPYTEIPIQLDALAGFHQLGTFLSRVEQGEHPMQLRSLRISENPKLLRRQVVKMTLAAYLLPSTSSGKPAAANAPGSTGSGGS